jgi:hydroxyacylglutathione hydrolase
LNSKLPVAVICASGYRSSAATSILERCGFLQVFNVVGGTNGWINAGYPVERPNEGAK